MSKTSILLALAFPLASVAFSAEITASRYLVPEEMFWNDLCPSEFCVDITETARTEERARDRLAIRLFDFYDSECDSFARGPKLNFRTGADEIRFHRRWYDWSTRMGGNFQIDDAFNRVRCREYLDAHGQNRVRCSLRPDPKHPPVRCIIECEFSRTET
ncbi:MAG TPA: hypothetical protein DCS07_08255 [Bdellovibrionales bacterium]|nr:MAG: hypothetical protein A2Z97_00425 [Bdellovibrionales bacterium GWB1_52_6]OFZ03234.1 MAG: hypothetical protein A2X97_09915 [Bdellovibrionales bacterium GWA1_52_35]OFZ38247.1 MAG: hypothetical protein A2070_05075 [Bdellovibrionales bacterium GWC1_52_8]HAR42608.1 hypothetical protein [Bdellovibrionales bacterium]HCM40584.1 hypothetical protein [Bdellovibrionales bacterium]